ncbi:uncharacterized protein FYW47_011357 [Aplochiton taeniatus]
MPPTPLCCLFPKPELVNSYTLVTDSPGLPRHDGLQANMSDLLATSHTEPPSLLNGSRVEKGASEEEVGEGALSLDSLLKRSREHKERETNTRGSKVNVANRVTRTPPPESLSDKENESRSPLGDSGVELGYSLRRTPLGSPQTQHQSPRAGCLSPSRTDPYAFLPRPEPSLSPNPQRRRPRPVSAGNIHISFPIGPADLIPRSPGRSGEFQGMAAWGEAPSGGVRSPDHWGSMGSGAGGSRRSSHGGTSPVQETSSPVSSLGHRDPLGPGFRRRCHTLDSQQHPPPSHCRSLGSPHIDRSQERAPRFIGGAPRFAPSRKGPGAPTQPVTKAPQGPGKGRIAPTALSNGLERQNSRTEETQLCVQALEDRQRRLAEEHALQMALLLAEQGKEQQRLQQLRAALYDVHDIFFEIPLGERLALLQQDRELRAERKLREMEKAKSPKERVALSAATQRSLDRKKRVGPSPGQARKMQQKPKSPTPNRVLKPNQGQNSPVPGQLNRQGSWYRKTPEERVRCSDSLKKQHSLS